MRALVIGATGVMGRRTSAELARSSEVDSMLLVARDGAEANELAEILGGDARKVAGRAVDARDPDEVAAVATDVDVIVSCAGPTYESEHSCVEAAIRNKVAYVSLCDDHEVVEPVLGLGSDAMSAGATVVTGCGVSPGITNLLASIAAEELELVEQVEIAIGVSAADSDGAAASAHFVHMLSLEAPYVSDGRRATVRAATLPKPVYLPEPLGWVETFRSGHPEVYTLPRKYKDASAFSFRIGLTERAVMDATRAMVATGVARDPRRAQLALRLSAPLRSALQLIGRRGPAWSAARIDVHGLLKDNPHTVSLGVADHLVNLATAPLVHAALELGTRRISGPGVHAPEDIFQARPFLRAIEQRGVRVARLEPHPV